jgi:hypothetical protein
LNAASDVSVCGRLGGGNIDRRPPPRKRAEPGRGTEAAIAALSAVVPSMMEDPMCWEMDYYWFAELQKAQEKQREEQKQTQRADAIDKLLSDANKEADKPQEAPPVKETVPAK